MEGKVLGSEDNESSVTDDASSMTAKLRKHKDYKDGKEPKHRLCHNRGIMENIAAKHQQKQGEEINNNRAKLSKVQLDIGDIGSIYVEGNTKAATDHSWLPVMVTKIIIHDSDSVNYQVCSKHGYLEGEFCRNQIMYAEHMTAEVLQIDPRNPNFKKKSVTRYG
jgi:ribosomal protein S12